MTYTRFQRCGQPTQQHGLRIPPLSFEIPFLIRIFLVSAFLPEVTQQIHSLRASGVMSSHTARAAGAAVIAFRKSPGIVCTTPPASPFLIIWLFYQILLCTLLGVWYDVQTCILKFDLTQAQ